MSQALRSRAEIDPAYTWDAASVFASHAEWEAAIVTAEERSQKIAEYKGWLGEGPQTVMRFLEAVEELNLNAWHVGVYATLFFAVDTNDQQAVAMRDRAQALASRAQAAMAFGEPELLGLGHEQLQAWMEEFAPLAKYRHYFERLFARAPHVRSAEVEQILSMVRGPFDSANAIHGVLANADLHFTNAVDSQGTEHEIAQGTINALVTAADPALRTSAWEHYADSHLAFGNTMAACLATGVKQNVFTARARNYGSALEAALKPNFIPTDVFHNLIAVYERNLPTWHRYWELRRRFLGHAQLSVADSKAPLTAEPMVVPYAQAVEWICDGMAPLGSEYVEIMRRGLVEQRWVDVYPNRGKRAGAFSMGAPKTHPFIMMSYNDDIFGLSTLAHELGHSMHSYYSRSTQPVVYANYGLFLAETASNFNQALVRAHLFERLPERDAQIAIIEEAMANFHRYFFIMPTLARFELAIHQMVEQGKALTNNVLTELTADLFSEGYGPSVTVDRARVGSTWMQFSTHLYANFYVYQYATGISAAHAVAKPILAGEAGAAERYIEEFLKAGGSRFPLETLQRIGVDMTTPAPVEAGFAVLAELVERLENVLF